MKRWIFGYAGLLHLAAENRTVFGDPPLPAHLISRLCDGEWQRYSIADHGGVEGDPGAEYWGVPVCAKCRERAPQAGTEG